MSDFSTLIRNARVMDGSGNPWFYGDVAIADDRIAAVTPPGRIDVEQVSEVIDASGHVVCPGFIDIQSHSILSLMVDGRSVSKLLQGVTTEIMGEGWTPAPIDSTVNMDFVKNRPLSRRIPEWMDRMHSWTRFNDWLEAMEAVGVSPNIGSFLGGGMLRRIAMGMRTGKPSADEMATMRETMAAAMEGGAFGVSYALIYAPMAYAATDEIVEICKVVGRFRGVYITHLRSEADQLLEGLDEALEIGRRADLPVEVYHLKAAGRANWPKLPDVLDRIDRARADGVDITADMYPYTAMGTGLSSIFPPWADADRGFLDNLRDPQKWPQIRAEALNPGDEWEAMVQLCGAESVIPIELHHPENLGYVGRSLAEIGASRGQEWVDAARDLFLSEGHRIGAIFHAMDEENLRRQLQQPWIKISTDAGGYEPSWGREFGATHPRAYGTYTRVLGKYVRDEAVLPLEDAIHKMSWAVAQRLGIRDRGLLCRGFYADVVILNPDTVIDQATFMDPHQLSVGIRDVWGNGRRVVGDGQHTGAKPGRFVPGPGRSK